ncbi:MAG: tetratricopeptide repeat protein [Muribaculaceae bacterium]|nr:tetratricopeptide repeat protein [Muribaculaceae bacterium]
MKPSSLDPLFLPDFRSKALQCDFWHDDISVHLTRKAVADNGLDRHEAIICTAAHMAETGCGAQATSWLSRLHDLLQRFNRDNLTDTVAVVSRTMAALLYMEGRHTDALKAGADALTCLAGTPRRKDDLYLSTLAATLYDISLIHSELHRYRQAEREITKALKLFERLAKSSPERYAPAVMLALDASTAIYRSRIEQVNLLAHYQVATTTYIEMARTGTGDAASRLIDSLGNEGKTLACMGRHREAVQFFTRALRYLTRMEPEFTVRHLSLSVDLGQSLLETTATRDKGIHLLNTMLHKSTRLGADDEHLRIVNILIEAKNPSLSILSLWHKIFPK